MLPNMQQKDRSGVLTSLWSINPHKNQWTMMAKVYSFLRAELGKDAVLLPSFLEHACNVLRIPPLDSYLQQQGFALLENDTGSLSLVNQAKAAPSSPAPKHESRDSDEKCQTAMGIPHDGTVSFTETPGFLNFKHSNQESLDAAVSAFQEADQQKPNPAGGFGNEEAAAGLYAEHELLQAVFDRGLGLDPKTLKEGETVEKQKQLLVQKLYSMAYEMLIGGEFPVIVGTKGFSHTIKHNPIAAVSQLFSRQNKLEFDVLVVDSEDQVKNHVFCQVNPEGSDKAVVLPTSGQRTADVHTVAGPFYSSTPQKAGDAQAVKSELAANSTPTYTQKMAYQSPENGGRFHIFTSQPSTLGNSIITNNHLGDSASPIASNSGLTNTQGSPESYASFEGHGSVSCSTSPPAGHDATNIIGEGDGGLPWMHGLDTSSLYGENEPMDINYAQDSASGRRFSLGCASDAETIITASQPKADLSWHDGQYASAATIPASNYAPGVQQAPFLTASQSMSVLPETGRAVASAHLVQHARKRTHDAIDFTHGNAASASISPSGRNTKRSRGRLSQDMGYLVHTLAQNPAELQAQLSHGQRPAVFDHIYRAQLAQTMAQNQTVSRYPCPTAPNAPGSPTEDPMMPPMHALERMQPVQPVQLVRTVQTVQTTPGLLSYNFSATMPNIYDTQHSSSLAAAFFSVNNTADASVLDLSDPAMLDRFLGLASDNTESVDSQFNWPCS